MTDHASLRAALAGGAEFDDMTIITVRKGDLRALLADYDRMRDAVQETVRVIESNPSSITDTVWVTDNMPETLLDRCRAALAQEHGESDARHPA